MSYLQFNDYYKSLVRSGRMPVPYPYYYPYNSRTPNLSNQDCENKIFCAGEDYIFDRLYDYNANCANYADHSVNNLSCIDNNSYYDKYDYCAYGLTPYQDPACAMGFTIQKIVSNIPLLARNLDVNALDPWGIMIVRDVVWVANTGSGLITSYDLLGRPLLPVINVFGPLINIAQPTGIVFNCDIFAFPIWCGPINGPSNILIATRDGTINGYNFDIDPDNSILLIDNSNDNCVYTGLAIYETTLYVADFYNQKIDVYNGLLEKIKIFPFVDECLDDPMPPDFAPFNVVNICDLIYVTYAKQNPFDNQFQFPGIGNGYVNIFTLGGIFVKRFVSRGVLNTPWGLTLIPSWFGYPAGSIMISNFGDGTINIFDSCGKYLGAMRDGCNNNICIEGIRGLANNPNYDRVLYWTCSANNLRDAFVGTIYTRSII